MRLEGGPVIRPADVPAPGIRRGEDISTPWCSSEDGRRSGTSASSAGAVKVGRFDISTEASEQKND
jgi:hypothetical protein